MGRKKIKWIGIIFLLLLTVFCGKDKRKVRDQRQEDEKWYLYVSQHTSGTVSKKSHIKVMFVNNVEGKSESLQEQGDIFDFEPAIKGKSEWTDARELVFIPEEDLIGGQEYKVTVNMARLLTLPKEYREYTFSFQVIKQDFEVLVDGLVTDEEQMKDRQKLRGRLNTSDQDESALVEKLLKVKQQGKDLPLVWEHDADGCRHLFTVSGIQRQEKASEVELSWDGSPIGVDRQGKRAIPVAALSDFKVIEVSAVQGDQQYVLLRFSDPIMDKQNLNGFIRISEHKVNFQIENNMIRVYSSAVFRGSVSVTVDSGIKSVFGYKLTQGYTQEVVFESIKPDVRFVGQGVIIPENKQLLIPIEAVNLHSVQVTAFEVFSQNIGQFLQVNSFGGQEELDRVGRYLWRKTIQLSQDPSLTGKWSRYHLDVTDVFARNPGSLFRLILTYNRGNSTYDCPESNQPVKKEPPYENQEDLKRNDYSNWDYADNYYNQERMDWGQRENPCNDAYYNPSYNRDRIIKARNFIASNIGIIAKYGEDNTIHVVATDIRNTLSISGASVKILNFQNQVLAQATTDQYGMASLRLPGVPFYISVQKGEDTGYLKVNKDSALPLSHFDIGGELVKRGIKGTIYGERGVWRPGDTLYLTFVLHDRDQTLPQDHPVIMEIFNPQGQSFGTYRPEKAVGRFYAFKVNTEESAITGNYKAQVQVGGLTFDQALKIEMVVPNRLKINLDFGQEVLYMSKMPVVTRLFSQWLHGGSAGNLKADVNVRYSSKVTQFDRFKDFVFDDPTKTYAGGTSEIFSGKLDQNGKAEFEMNLEVEKNSPGMLNASFESRVHEEGGGFSSDRITVPFHPYAFYVGLSTPKGDEARGMLLTDTKHVLKIATVNAQGSPVSRKKIKAFLYKIHWKWWWDKTGDSLAQYASTTSNAIIQSGEVSTTDGMGEWKFEVKYPNWGRYLLRLYDAESGHSSGKIIFIDWPGWAGRAREEKGVGATRLNFTADKKSYKVGETAVIYLPEMVEGRALVSLENSTRVIRQFWHEAAKGESKFSIPIDEAMAPNFYVHISVLQPHANKKSDTPIRLYGVIPIMVENPNTQLFPQIKTADEFKPNETVQIKVSEKNGRAVTYTLALVDEGLLGLTRYQTPDLRNIFYQRESLGVRTWDLFDEVVGAYGTELERILTVGGDESLEEKDRESKKRFPPVVIFRGPFSLEAGKEDTHRLQLPYYIGAVRVMVVAGDGKAYGFVEKSVPVRQNLMILSSLPRVIRCLEEIEVPVSIFVMNEKIKDVSVNIQTNDMFEILKQKEKTVSFSTVGDQIVSFRIKAKAKIGQGKISIRARNGGFKASEETYIQVLTSNPKTVRLVHGVIEANKEWQQVIKPYGLEKSNQLNLEISAIPPLNLEKRLNYLIQFPHGCLEQTVSRAFPQLYLLPLVKMSDMQKKQVEKNIQAAIEKMKTFQSTSGGFTYWPGATVNGDEWASNYAGHFLLEAQKAGYHVSLEMMSNWHKFQKSRANTWTSGDVRYQAYRLYTMALAKKPDIGAMNRLREQQNLDASSTLLLAGAFALNGQKEAADELLSRTDLSVKPYRELAGTYGSQLRDQAMILSILSQLGKVQLAKRMLDEINKVVASDQWLSTQETAYILMSLTSFYRTSPGVDKFTFALKQDQGKFVEYSSDKPVFKKEITPFADANGVQLTIKNPNPVGLYLILYNEGIPPAGEEKEISEQLKISIDYFDTDQKPINVNKVAQGTDIIADIKISNPSAMDYENLVLNHFVPSGWQIHNPRFDSENQANSLFDYQDIRDDRLYTYFKVPARTSKTFRVLLNASYLGRFYLPGLTAEAMYDFRINATTKGQWIDVEK